MTGNVILFSQARKWCCSNVSSLFAVSSLCRMCLLQVSNSNFFFLQSSETTENSYLVIAKKAAQSISGYRDTETNKASANRTCCIFLRVRKGAGVIFIMPLQYVRMVILFTFNCVYVSVWVCAHEHRCLWSQRYWISRTWRYGAVVSHPT